MTRPVSITHRPRPRRGRPAWAGLLGIVMCAGAAAAPYVPERDEEVLASLPPGIRHTSEVVREQAGARLDVALPLAQFYITQARATGDLRFLGYADAVLARWRAQEPVLPAVRVLNATILQSRHAFDGALLELDAALKASPDDAQAWLTRATVLRVLGRYDEGAAACRRLGAAGDQVIGALCVESL